MDHTGLEKAVIFIISALAGLIKMVSNPVLIEVTFFGKLFVVYLV